MADNFKVLYWDGVLSSNIDLQPYKQLFLKLKHGDYKSADLSLKKNGKGLYTARINKSDRLLFTTVAHQGKRYILLLEVIDNHKYLRSPFMQHPELLKDYLPHLDTSKAISFDEFEDLDDGEEIIEKDEQDCNDEDINFQFKPAFYYNKEFLSFSTEQNQVRNAPLPLILSGAPGSGKSCIALSLLSSAAEQISDDNTQKKALFITQSPRLVKEMIDNWQALPSAHQAHFKVDFLSYQQLIEKNDSKIKDKTRYSEVDFNAWFDGIYLRSEKNRNKVNSAAKSIELALIKQREYLYQEFRIICAYDKQSYIDLGKKQSFFENQEIKAAVFDMFTTYQAYLDSKSAYDPSFLNVNLESRYDLVVSDESQDWSYRQIMQIMKLAIDHNFCFLFDSNQSLNDAHSILSYLKQQFYIQGIATSYFELPDTYRCPENISNLANVILGIKHKTADRSDKAEAKEIGSAIPSEMTGHVEFIKRLDGSQMNQVKELAKSPTLTVITPPEFIEEAKRLFKTPMVFTPLEYKGQQNKTVVVFRPFQEKDFERFILNDQSDHRDLRPVFNRLFTSITRATNNLYMVQPPYHKTTQLFKQVLEAFKPQMSQQAKVTEAAKPSTVPGFKQWEEQFHQQLAYGNKRQAREILRQYLKNDRKLAQLVGDKEEELKPQLSSAIGQHHAKSNALSTNTLSNKEKRELTSLLRQWNPQNFRSKLNKIINNDKFLVFLFEHALEDLHLTKNNVKYLIKYLNENPEFYTKITEELLFITPATSKRTKTPITAFYRLAAMAAGEGHDLLYEIFRHSQERFLEKLSSEILSYDPKANKCHTMVFIELLKSINGRKFLRDVFSNNPKLASFMTKEILYDKILVVPELGSFRTNVFYLLLSGDVVCTSILRMLFLSNPKELLKLVTKKNIFQTKILNNSLINMFHAFCVTDEGIEFIELLLDHRPDLFKNSDDLDFVFDIQQHKNEMGCLVPYQMLLVNEKSRKILLKLFDINPNLYHKLTPDHLFKPYQLPLENKTFKHLDYLLQDTTGLIILSELLRINPLLLEHLRHEQFFCNSGGFRLSHFEYLSRREIGQQILIKLFMKYPDMLNDLNEEQLFTPREDIMSSQKINTFKDLMTIGNTGRILLTLIIRKRPDLLTNINPSTLNLFEIYSTVKAKDARYELKLSTIGYLLYDRNKLCVALLKDIFNLSPSLALAITSENLASYCVLVNKHKPDQTRPTTLRNVLQEDFATPLREKLEEINPALFKRQENSITTSAFFHSSARASTRTNSKEEEKTTAPVNRSAT